LNHLLVTQHGKERPEWAGIKRIWLPTVQSFASPSLLTEMDNLLELFPPTIETSFDDLGEIPLDAWNAQFDLFANLR
jgi:hypothetical protein